MKKIFSLLTALITTLVIITNIFVIQVYASSLYTNLYLCNMCSNLSHFIDDNTYVTKSSETINLTNETSSNWFNDKFSNTFKFKWIKDPKLPINFEEFLSLIFNIQMSAEPNKTYPRRDIEYEDLDNYSYDYNMIQILSSTGTWDSPSILNGTPTDNGKKLNFNDNITRAQAAKVIDKACSDWYKIEKSRNSINFIDISDSWAKDYIINTFEYGFMNGKDAQHFEPDSYLSIEEAITILYNITNEYEKYTINNFVDAINYSDIAKIIEVYSNDFTNSLYTEPYKFTRYYDSIDTSNSIFYSRHDFPDKWTINYTYNTIYTYKDPQSSVRIVPNIYSYLTGRIGPITIIPPETPYIKLEKDGSITLYSEIPEGLYTFTIINENDEKKELNLQFYKKPEQLKLKRNMPENLLTFNGTNTVYLEVGESIDLNDYLKNVSGSYHVYCEAPKYVSFDGTSKITLVKKPPTISDYNTDSDKIYISDDYTNVVLYIKSSVN